MIRNRNTVCTYCSEKNTPFRLPTLKSSGLNVATFKTFMEFYSVPVFSSRKVQANIISIKLEQCMLNFIFHKSNLCWSGHFSFVFGGFIVKL